jgi:hypothetical protein
MRKTTQLAGAVMRNVAAILILAAERLDPQPPVEAVWPFTVETGNGTLGAEARVTWHTKFHETA